MATRVAGQACMAVACMLLLSRLVAALLLPASLVRMHSLLSDPSRVQCNSHVRWSGCHTAHSRTSLQQPVLRWARFLVIKHQRAWACTRTHCRRSHNIKAHLRQPCTSQSLKRPYLSRVSSLLPCCSKLFRHKSRSLSPTNCLRTSTISHRFSPWELTSLLARLSPTLIRKAARHFRVFQSKLCKLLASSLR